MTETQELYGASDEGHVEAVEADDYAIDDLEPIPEEEIDLDAELEAEGVGEDEPEKALLPEWAETKRVRMYDRDFEIGEPDIGITLRIIRVIGVLGVRGEKSALRALQSLVDKGRPVPEVSWRAHLFGMLASLYEADLIALASAVLQFADDREGRKFLNNPPTGHRLTLSPIIRAFWLNIAQSEDLRDALNDFFVGMGMTSDLLETLGGFSQ